ncbi:MAG: hypothetical protein ACW98X_07085 [Promethearchaeota archaeon]|jgi:hypothetical protein
MILKLKVKDKKKKRIVAWIQRTRDFDDNLQQIFKFFEGKVKISKWSWFSRYYKVSSENPAMILSMFSTVQDLIPDIYFSLDDSIEIEDLPSK